MTAGYKTYDHLPMQAENAPYPFVIIGDMNVVSSSTKTSLQGNVVITIDVWGDEHGRLTVSEMVERLFKCSIGVINTKHYRYFGHASEQTKDFTQDQTVKDTILNRGTLTVTLKII